MSNNIPLICLLIIIVILTCSIYLLMRKENFTTSRPNLLNNGQSGRDLKRAIAERLNIEESRITHLIVNAEGNNINLGIHNSNLNNNSNFETVNSLRNRINNMIQEGTLGITLSNGMTYNLSNSNATVEVVNTSESNTETNNGENFADYNNRPKPSNSETFSNQLSNQYIENYNPVFDNINMIKASIYLKDRYNHSPRERELNEFIKLDYDNNMNLIAKTELETCL